MDDRPQRFCHRIAEIEENSSTRPVFSCCAARSLSRLICSWCFFASFLLCLGVWDAVELCLPCIPGGHSLIVFLDRCLPETPGPSCGCSSSKNPTIRGLY